MGFCSEKNGNTMHCIAWLLITCGVAWVGSMYFGDFAGPGLGHTSAMAAASAASFVADSVFLKDQTDWRDGAKKVVTTLGHGIGESVAYSYMFSVEGALTSPEWAAAAFVFRFMLGQYLWRWLSNRYYRADPDKQAKENNSFWMSSFATCAVCLLSLQWVDTINTDWNAQWFPHLGKFAGIITGAAVGKGLSLANEASSKNAAKLNSRLAPRRLAAHDIRTPSGPSARAGGASSSHVLTELIF